MVRRDGVAVSGQVVFFVVTDTRCVVHGNAYPGIPIFFDTDGVIERKRCGLPTFLSLT